MTRPTSRRLDFTGAPRYVLEAAAPDHPKALGALARLYADDEGRSRTSAWRRRLLDAWLDGYHGRPDRVRDAVGNFLAPLRRAHAAGGRFRKTIDVVDSLRRRAVVDRWLVSRIGSTTSAHDRSPFDA